MKKLLLNLFYFSLIGIIPLIILIAAYFYFDPFKVLYKYNDYSNSIVEIDRDYVSTEMLKKNEAKYHYNSFIFGSSRTGAFRPMEWKKHLLPTDQPFSFDASFETIYGIFIKVKYLDENNYKIDNALIILCRDHACDSEGNNDEPNSIKDPTTSHESELKFQFTFLKAYLHPFFMLSYYYYKCTHQFKGFMADYINNKTISYDPVTNALIKKDREREITYNTYNYYLARKDMFYTRLKERTDSVQEITPKIAEMLKEIARIFKKHNTSYKVVLSPLYEQMKFSKNDMVILKSVFGNKLYDFTGKNSYTENKYNYYEIMHFRPNVGASIMNTIYK